MILFIRIQVAEIDTCLLLETDTIKNTTEECMWPCKPTKSNFAYGGKTSNSIFYSKSQ